MWPRRCAQRSPRARTPGGRHVPRLPPVSHRRLAVLTYLARQQAGAQLEQWRAAKSAASEAIARRRADPPTTMPWGAIRPPWLAAEVGELGLAALRALKARVDPVVS
jgi:FAD/FMN-containing dehydrogenase